MQIIIPLIARCRRSGWFYSVLITPHQCPHPSPKAQTLPSENITLKAALISFTASLHSVIWYQKKKITLQKAVSYFNSLSGNHILHTGKNDCKWEVVSETVSESYHIVQAWNWAASTNQRVFTEPLNRITEVHLRATAICEERKLLWLTKILAILYFIILLMTHSEVQNSEPCIDKVQFYLIFT